MHPKTEKITQKHALSNNEKKPKSTTKPWFSRLLRHPARKRSGSILGHKTHTHIHLLAFPGPTRGQLADERGVCR